MGSGSDATRARASPDLPCPQPLHRMGQQLLGSFKKSNRVRQLRMYLKPSFIHPLGMNRELRWLSERFKYMDCHTTNLGSRRINHSEQFFAKLHRLSRLRFEPD
jgi:hypothetical protein